MHKILTPMNDRSQFKIEKHKISREQSKRKYLWPLVKNGFLYITPKTSSIDERKWTLSKLRTSFQNSTIVMKKIVKDHEKLFSSYTPNKRLLFRIDKSLPTQQETK